MTIGSLFTGIGGFDLGFELVGIGLVKWQVEIDKTCNRVLPLHWPAVRRFQDIRDCGRENLEPMDIICGGFPCQDLSIAGKRAGLSGTRSGLFYEMTRIIDELQPAFVVWENVPGLLNSDRGRDMLRVLCEFHRIRYHGAWRVFDAQYFGVAQRRRRVFGVFARADIGAERCAEILALREGMSGHPAPRREAGEGFAADVVPGLTASGRGVERTGESPGQDPVIACTMSSKWAKGSGGPAGDEVQNLVPVRNSGRGYWQEDDKAATLGTEARAIHEGTLVAFSSKDNVRRLTPTEYERLQGFPDGWTAGESDSARYRMLGNAVAVPVARWIGRRIQLLIRKEPHTMSVIAWDGHTLAADRQVNSGQEQT